jgi:hypothetical protein
VDGARDASRFYFGWASVGVVLIRVIYVLRSCMGALKRRPYKNKTDSKRAWSWFTSVVQIGWNGVWLGALTGAGSGVIVIIHNSF